MADFLTRVAQRAMGVAPVVKPVIRSRYSPVEQGPSLPEEVTETSGALEATPQLPAPARRVSGPKAVERPDGTLRVQRTQPREETQERPVLQGPRESIGEPVGTPRLAAAETAAEEAPAAPLPTAQFPKSPPILEREPAAIDNPTPAEATGFAPVMRPAALPLKARAEHREPAAEAAPAIRVTIGRVEVRAVAAPSAPARREAPRRPALTLEEYTRQRKRGER